MLGDDNDDSRVFVPFVSQHQKYGIPYPLLTSAVSNPLHLEVI